MCRLDFILFRVVKVKLYWCYDIMILGGIVSTRTNKNAKKSLKCKYLLNCFFGAINSILELKGGK